MISLFPFQIEASTTIANRYQEFIDDPERPRQKGYGLLPFYQSLHALTGSGKTPILADTIAQMRIFHPIEPIVLWISKAKVVVEQTLANFTDGGKYYHLIDRFSSLALRDCTPNHIADANCGLILLGTVATFNSKERGDRLIFEMRKDIGKLSLWDTLIQRKSLEGVKRPLIIVYDEGHNLTDQQAGLLLELRPDAIIIASATPRLPSKLTAIVDFLKLNGYSDEVLRTSIHSSAVVEAELVKKTVQLGGYVTAEEVAISAMINDHYDLLEAAKRYEAPFEPKCIYVCKTNEKDDEQKPFSARQSPPIRIWKYLTSECNIDPADIAVYCDLKVSPAHPLPPEFILFRGGENDYGKFIAGNYKHIIFNLSLQEGWDDPECYLAYIDKSMGSELQIEQVIGRVLRQPGAHYYPDAKLNSSGFYIHVDEAGIFMDILKSVQSRIAQDLPAVEVVSTGGPNRTIKPQQPRISVEIPEVILDMAAAADAVHDVLYQVSDYSNSSDSVAQGLVAKVKREIGANEHLSELEWEKKGQGMPVKVQWLLGRYIERQYPAARTVCDMSDPRFSRLIHVGSRAAKQLETLSNILVTTFLQHTTLGVLPARQIKINEATYDVNNYTLFNNSVHPAYSGLNADERECALAIDDLGWPWYRNPSNGGFSLPLLQPGTKRSFFPDFIIWTDTAIWLIDPKGDHLIKDDAGRKLIAIENTHGQLPLKVCLITKGTWDRNFNKLDNSGITAWKLKSGLTNAPEKYSDINVLLKKIIGEKV